MTELQKKSSQSAEVRDSANSGISFAPIWTIGGNKGSSFQFCKIASGAIPVKFETWSDTGSYMRGIRITYSDGSTDQTGSINTGTYAGMTLSPGETVTKLVMYGNGIGTRFGRIEITTTAQTFSAGKSNVSGQNAYAPPLGAGILAGFLGNSGSDIDNLGLMFLDNVASVTLNDISYINAPPVGSMTGITTVVVGYADYPPASAANDWKFEDSISYENVNSWTDTETTEWFVNVSVSAEIFGIGTKVSAGWQTTSTTSNTTEQRTTVTVDYDRSGTLAPNQGVRCTATSGLGTLNLSYTGTLFIQFNSGATASIPVSGTYRNAVYTQATVTLDFYNS